MPTKPTHHGQVCRRLDGAPASTQLVKLIQLGDCWETEDGIAFRADGTAVAGKAMTLDVTSIRSLTEETDQLPESRLLAPLTETQWDAVRTYLTEQQQARREYSNALARVQRLVAGEDLYAVYCPKEPDEVYNQYTHDIAMDLVAKDYKFIALQVAKASQPASFSEAVNAPATGAAVNFFIQADNAAKSVPPGDHAAGAGCFDGLKVLLMRPYDQTVMIQLLNTELGHNYALEPAESLNKVYRSLTGHDHESMELRRRRAAKSAEVQVPAPVQKG